MRCDWCHGTGRRLNPALTVTNAQYEAQIDNPDRLPVLVTCDECGGSGIVHCCEGLQTQPPQQPH